MYEEVTSNSNSFAMQNASNGSLSSGGRYGNSYYGDPSAALLSAAASSAACTYGDLLLQPSTVCYAPSYTADGSSGAGCKQSYYHQEESYGQEQDSPSSTRYLDAGGHHPGRTIQTSPSTSSSPSAAAAEAVAEATAALRLATTYSMFVVKSPSQPAAGTFSLRGPSTADAFTVADRLAAEAAAAAADFAPASAGPSSGYVQPSGVGLGKMASATYGTAAPTAFHLSSDHTGDASTSFHGGLHGFHPAANGFLSTAAGTSGAAYSPFQKLQTPWTTPRMTMDAYSSLDVCKFTI